MALVAHRMMLPARHRRTQQQVARNKVGVLLVPSLADYYNKDGDQLQQQPQQQQQLQLQLQQQVTPATSQLELQAGEGKCAQGRAAWLERGRRCSVQEQQQQQATCHRRWVKRNRIQDASLGGSSDDEDFLGVLRGPSTFANAFLYVGLGTVALGLVIAFVGTGEKGFKTVELRLIGPSLIGLGLICCILRILFCICPSHCISSSKKTRKKNGNKIDADHTTSLLRNESKRVSIARGPAVQPKYPIAHKRSQSKMLNEGMEALRQIATTSLFMQNEQKTAINRVVPIINEPESMDHMGADAPLEMKKLQTALNMCEMSDEEQEIVQQQQLQLAKRTATTTTAVTSSTTKATAPTESTAAATATKATTTLSTVDEKPNSKLVRQRVALQQQRQLQQQQRQQQQQHQQLQEQPEQSQSLSSSSTVRDSLDGIVVVEETSLMDTEIVPPTTTSTATSTSTSTAPMPMALPSSCSTGAIPRLKSNTAAFSTPAQRPGISTGATPKTTTTPTTTNNNTRLTSSQSHPTSYDLPPAQPHTYSAAATVRGPLGMTLTGSSSVYAMPASRLSGLTATSSASPTLSTTTTISLLPLPAPPTSSIAGTAMASIPGQVLEPTGIATTSLSILQPLTAAKAATGATGMTGMTSAMTMQRPATASSASTSASLFGMEHKSQPSSASATVGGRGSSLLPPPQPSASKFEPELVLSPAKLGQ
ncbi:pneumococcal serine-rich repeat protein isoform X2 [Drosophila albomicans]|uniref:Pneumococcal serine-rich repeat protein isoform X2 n=1 Tax=Drosophila albomicans TaxID=7291 RepID=A0A9C6W4G4_DROAB|nr:pneumococcal serine-rich repeat protein isoform X2 [Drosophila albomicans]